MVFDNRLVGICTVQKLDVLPPTISDDCIIKEITFTTIYDHSKFARQILNFNGKTLEDVEDSNFHNLLRENPKPLIFNRKNEKPESTQVKNSSRRSFLQCLKKVFKRS